MAPAVSTADPGYWLEFRINSFGVKDTDIVGTLWLRNSELQFPVIETHVLLAS
jgi:hypothetical protein